MFMREMEHRTPNHTTVADLVLEGNIVSDANMHKNHLKLAIVVVVCRGQVVHAIQVFGPRLR
jgi:hypothetical protein